MMVRLFVLGALRDGPRHGYRVRREAEIDRTDAWADIKPGSIHNALHRMAKDGSVRVAEVAQDVGPARTVFEMTPAGARELTGRTRDALRAAVAPADPFDVALRLADGLSAPDVVRALEERRAAFADRVHTHRTTYVEVRRHLSAWESRAFEHVIARLEFELDWVNGLLGRLEVS